jgi:hypothetical protein
VNASAHHRSHTSAWIGAIIGVAFLYVATWPVIEMKCTKVTTSNTREWFVVGHVYAHTLGSTSIEYPQWAPTVYAPLHWFCETYQEPNPLVRYWDWWNAKLKFQGGHMWRPLERSP